VAYEKPRQLRVTGAVGAEILRLLLAQDLGSWSQACGKAVDKVEQVTNEGCRTSIVRVFKHTLYGDVMDELLRIGFVSLGTLAILAYLVHVARTEGTFHRRR
jgi:hypothetical protein